MTDGLRKSHLRKAHQVGLSEVGLPEGNQYYAKFIHKEGFARVPTFIRLFAKCDVHFIKKKFLYQCQNFIDFLYQL